MIITTNENYGLASLVTQIALSFLSKDYWDICIFWRPGSFESTLSTILKYSQWSQGNTQSNITLPPYRLYKFDENEKNHQTMVLAAVNYGCRVFFISTAASLDFSNVYLSVMYLFSQRNPDNHFIFIPSDDTDHSDTDRVLNLGVSVHIPDYLVISPFSKESGNIFAHYDVVTTKFVGRYNNSLPVVLNTFNTEQMRFENELVDLFPNKLQNLHGRSLKLSLVNYKPYSLWYNTEPGLGNAIVLDSDEEKTIFIDGTEPRIFLTFCEKYNCTVVAWAADQIDPLQDNWGITFDNGSGTGLLGAIADKKVDIGVSALGVGWYAEYLNLDQSIAIQRTSVTIMVPRPKLKPKWQLPALPFSMYLWFAVLASFAVAVTGLVVVDYFVDLSIVNTIPEHRVNLNKILFEVAALLLGQTTKRVLLGTPALVLYGSILLINLILDSAYTGGLSSFLTQARYEDPIDTLHQFAAKGWIWGGLMDSWVSAILFAQQPDLKRIVELFTILPYDQLEAHLKTGDIGYGIDKLQYGHFSVPSYITLESIDYLQLMHEDLYIDYTTAMCYKTWPYKRMLNPLIQQLIESGLLQIWELQVSLEHLDAKLQLALTNSRLHTDAGSFIPLSTSHLIGAFLLLILGYGIAAIAFAFELLVSDKLRKRSNLVHEFEI